jgi:hypothetical protein
MLILNYKKNNYITGDVIIQVKQTPWNLKTQMTLTKNQIRF